MLYAHSDINISFLYIFLKLLFNFLPRLKGIREQWNKENNNNMISTATIIDTHVNNNNDEILKENELLKIENAQLKYRIEHMKKGLMEKYDQ